MEPKLSEESLWREKPIFEGQPPGHSSRTFLSLWERGGIDRVWLPFKLEWESLMMKQSIMMHSILTFPPFSQPQLGSFLFQKRVKVNNSDYGMISTYTTQSRLYYIWNCAIKYFKRTCQVIDHMHGSLHKQHEPSTYSLRS